MQKRDMDFYPMMRNDIFVHFSALQMEGFKFLEEGDKVEYEVVDGDKRFIRQQMSLSYNH